MPQSTESAIASIGSTVTVVPPYAGPGFGLYTSVNTFPSIWYAYRHKPLTGEIVMQLGSLPATDFQIGILQVGFQYTFTPEVTGFEQIVVDVAPGPITRRNATVCRAEVHLTGPGVNLVAHAALQSYRPTSILLTRKLQADVQYTLAFYGHLQLSFDAGESAYGEIITAFPKVTRFTAAAPLVAAPAAASTAYVPVREQRAHPTVREIGIAEAIAAGAEGIVGE